MHIIRYVLSLAVIIGIFSAPGKGLAVDRAFGIAAIVDDSAITTKDLAERTNFIIATTGLTNSNEIRVRITPQVLRSLIDEELQLQEAARNDITVPEGEVSAALAAMERERGIEPGKLTARLQRIGINPDTFRNQIKAQLSWAQVVLQTIRPSIKISEEELLRARRKKPVPNIIAEEIEIEVLVLPVDKPENDAQVRLLAEKLSSEIKRGASFNAVARELGGEGSIGPFWVEPGQLEETIAGVVSRTPTGKTSDPVRGVAGYTMVKVNDRRGEKSNNSDDSSEVILKDILLKLKPDAPVEDAQLLLQIGKEVAKYPGTCEERGVAGIAGLDGFDIEVQYRRERTRLLAEKLSEMVKELAVGGVTEPVATPEGLRLFMLCERLQAPPELVDEDAVRQLLYRQKVELEALKLLRKLRRDAFIDLRLPTR